MKDEIEKRFNISCALSEMGSSDFKKVESISYSLLPLFAKIALDRLANDSKLRNSKILDELLQSYADFYLMKVDMITCLATHSMCKRRFSDFESASAC